MVPYGNGFVHEGVMREANEIDQLEESRKESVSRKKTICRETYILPVDMSKHW